MRNLANWGRMNKNAARIIIVFSYIFLNILGLFLGDILFSLNLVFSPLFYVFTILTTLTGWMIYPTRSRKNEYRNYFVRQKSADFILICATFLFTVYLGNSMNTTRNSIFNPVHAISIIHTSESIIVGNNSTAKVSLYKKSLRQKIRAEIKNIRKAYKNAGKSEKTGYIIVAIFCALILFYGVTALACSISCSGSEALAWVVFGVGLGGIIFGLVKIIQRINRGKPKG